MDFINTLISHCHHRHPNSAGYWGLYTSPYNWAIPCSSKHPSCIHVGCLGGTGVGGMGRDLDLPSNAGTNDRSAIESLCA